MDITSRLAQQAIVLFQTYIKVLGFSPSIHFELEGCYQFATASRVSKRDPRRLNFARINQQLDALGIDGELVPEYWQNQWEYISKFNGQTPLKEAHNLTAAIKRLPYLLAQQGVSKTLIKPVVWSGDQGKLATGCDNVFSDDRRAVHIPNAIQINVSALNSQGENIVAKPYFGEYLQQCFLQTSLSCCLLYLPEQEAFERFALTSTYGLSDELCSPHDISGGHQGSIALYRQLGKHNQPMGLAPLLYDQHHNVLLNQQDWQKTARIEHRLGASSIHYNAYTNVAFALANLVDALEVYLAGNCQQALQSNSGSLPLPKALTGDVSGFDALNLFANSNWLSQRINAVQQSMQAKPRSIGIELPDKLGDKLKLSILGQYQSPQVLLC